MRHGDRGTEVRAWQRWLVSRGHRIATDGIFGNATEAATRAVQRAAGLQPSGVADAPTLALAEAVVRLEDRLLPEWDEQAARYGHVERAQAVVGLGAHDLPPYLDLIAPNAVDRANERTCRDLASMSGCALVVRGLWVRGGIRAPKLIAPYKVGRAVADVVAVATEAGALRAPVEPLRPGCVVVVGGPEHVLTVTSIQGSTVVSVDGGQRDEQGRQVIRERRRELQGTTLGGRPILHVVDPLALSLAWRNGAYAQRGPLG